jgi:PAS domain S-box-containing protein
MSIDTDRDLRMDDLSAARAAYLRGEPAPAGVRPVVLASWERCRRYGVDPIDLQRQIPDGGRLLQARAENGRLIEAAAPFLMLVNETLAVQPHVVVLADRRGTVLDALAGAGLERLEEANIFAGASWHEQDIGCNGVGTCLAAGEPVILIGPEHFQAAYVDWTCIGVPLRDGTGAIVGALDFSVPREDTHVHAWGWILSVAKGIELSLSHGVPGGQAEAELAVSSQDDPLHALHGIFDLLARGLDVSPTHARFLLDARAQLREVEAALADAVGRLRSSERQARRELEELRSIYDSAPIGLCVLDRDLRVVRINECLAEINGASVADHIGRTVREVAPGVADLVEPLLREAIETGESRIGHELTGETRARPGETRHWIEHHLPLRDADGHVFGLNLVVEEVTEQKRARQQMEASYEAARRAVAERDHVLAVVSHDLRNSLNTVVMASELLLLDLPEASKRTQATVIRRAADHMTRLVEDLLDVSLIEAGGLRLVRKRVAVDQLVQAAAESLGTLAAARSQQLVVQVPAGLSVRADRKRLLQVMDNLIGNAIKHSPEGGQIWLTAEEPAAEPGHVRFTVQDSGSGIPAEHAERVFDRFWQGARDAHAGAGLGLAIARGIVEAHGGRIWVESTEGSGAAFRFTLPAVSE